MSIEDEYNTRIGPNEVQPAIERWQQCGTLIADRLRRGDSLILDMDGVVVKSDSLDHPELTSPEIALSIKTLEDKGAKVGVATARGEQIVEYLRTEYELSLNGPLILEDGHVFFKDGVTEFIANPNHPKFISNVRQQLMLHPQFQISWNNVKTLSKTFGMSAFCPGNFQWQGKNRASFWYSANGYSINNQMNIIEVLDPIFRDLAQRHDLDYEKDLDVSVSNMNVGNLGIISIKEKLDGVPINKGTPARRLTQPWVLAADGFGDTELGIITKDLNGAVIGIEGNLDDSNEPRKFLSTADFVLRDPEELTLALSHAANCLEK